MGKFVPKRGRVRNGRSVMKTLRLAKKPAAQARGRPSARARATYTQSTASEIRGDPRDLKISKTLVDLARMTEAEIWDFMLKLGFAKDLHGERCPVCKEGFLGAKQFRSDGNKPFHRCSSYKCQHREFPWGQCPLLHHGRRSAPLHQQLMNLLCLSTTNSVTSTIHLTGHARRSVIHTHGLLQNARKLYVQRKEKVMTYGSEKRVPAGKWHDIEVDEASFGKMLLRPPRSASDKALAWESWIGILRRGHPGTRMLIRSKNPPTLARSPGPGPITKDQWKAIAKKHLQNRCVVIHTDSARAYRETNIPGTVRDQIVHKRKRVFNKKTGRYFWTKPKYVGTVQHSVDGKRFWRKSGTQTIDSCWRFLKARIHKNQCMKPGSRAFTVAIKGAQYEYWTRGMDSWQAMSALLE